jgi:hypothetical protein
MSAMGAGAGAGAGLPQSRRSTLGDQTGSAAFAYLTTLPYWRPSAGHIVTHLEYGTAAGETLRREEATASCGVNRKDPVQHRVAIPAADPPDNITLELTCASTAPMRFDVDFK